VVLRDAPWVFRDHLSSAAEVFEDGQWLRLVDGKNRIIGYGIYESRGAIAIRVLRRGEVPPDTAWLSALVDAALARRAPLREGHPSTASAEVSHGDAAPTNAFRAIHGESDGLPAVVLDVFADTLVVQSYSAGADALARLAARWVARKIGAARILMKPAQRRQGNDEAAAKPRWLLGGPVVEGGAAVSFHEGAIELTCDPSEGQKSGAFLDLRGLRRAVAAMSLPSARVLNLFSYTGMLGRCAERAGAREIWQVEVSAAALELAARYHVDDPGRHRMIVADVFEWLPAQPVDQAFELVIIDPPSMTSRRAQVPGALAAYRKLYRAAAPHVAPGGTLVAACCTSRITRPEFRKVVTAALGTDFEAISELPPEVDHPVTFAESDYLKILLYRRRSVR
jgi:23S rRNA (cytosine1962-C5)-methyltransferase